MIRPHIPKLGTGTVRRLFSHPVTQNALGLYAVQFAGYVIPLFTIPYLARVLRPQGFGLVVFAQSFALWASLVVEYGFNFSATRDVARSRTDPNRLSEIAAGVLGAKIVLVSGMVAIAVTAAFTVPIFIQHPAYLWWTIPQTLAFGFSPGWYFLGLERIVRSVLVEFLFRVSMIVLVFVLVRTPADGWKVLALQSAAGTGTLLVLVFWMYRDISFRWPTWHETRFALERGWNMFVVRGFYSVYSTANAFILGMFVGPLEVGYYGGGEKISKALQGLTLPVSHALYPRMSYLVPVSARKAARLAFWTVSLAGAIGLGLGAALALLVGVIVPVVLGPGYEPTIPVLYVFALLLPVNAINSALIMQWMLPLGMDKLVVKVLLASIAVNIGFAFLLAPRYAQVGMAWAILIAETFMFVTLAVALLRRSLTPLDVVRDAPPTSLELP